MKKILSKVIVAILLLTIIMSINTPINKTYISFPSHYAYADTQTGAFVTRFYQLFFDREPDAGGLGYWTNALLSGQKTGAEVSAYFVNGPEFKTLNVDDSTYLTMMYRAFFNREPDSSGMAYWQGYLDSGMSRYWVLNNFVISTEFNNICVSYGITRGTLPLTNPADLYPQITAFVTRFYKLCLNRMPDEGGLNYWVGDLAAGTRTGAILANDFVFSTEFVNRNLSNQDFVTIMMRAFFNREPDAGGLTYWTGILQSGGSRLNVLIGFVNSTEFGQICNDYGITRGSITPPPPPTTAIITLPSFPVEYKYYFIDYNYIYSKVRLLEMSYTYSGTTLTLNYKAQKTYDESGSTATDAVCFNLRLMQNGTLVQSSYEYKSGLMVGDIYTDSIKFYDINLNPGYYQLIIMDRGI